MDYSGPLTPITFKAPPELAAKLRELAQETRRSRSQVCRLLLEGAEAKHLQPWQYGRGECIDQS